MKASDDLSKQQKSFDRFQILQQVLKSCLLPELRQIIKEYVGFTLYLPHGCLFGCALWDSEIFLLVGESIHVFDLFGCYLRTEDGAFAKHTEEKYTLSNYQTCTLLQRKTKKFEWSDKIIVPKGSMEYIQERIRYAKKFQKTITISLSFWIAFRFFSLGAEPKPSFCTIGLRALQEHHFLGGIVRSLDACDLCPKIEFTEQNSCFGLKCWFIEDKKYFIEGSNGLLWFVTEGFKETQFVPNPDEEKEWMSFDKKGNCYFAPIQKISSNYFYEKKLLLTDDGRDEKIQISKEGRLVGKVSSWYYNLLTHQLITVSQDHKKKNSEFLLTICLVDVAVEPEAWKKQIQFLVEGPWVENKK